MLKSIMVVLIVAVQCVAASKTAAVSAKDVAAAVVCGEARGEGVAGMCAVWEVIHTRAAIKKVPISRVTVPVQFSCLNNKTKAELVAKMRKTPQWAFARKLVSSPPTTSYTRGATHFTRTDERPRWADPKKLVAVVGNHSFYRLL